MKKSSLILVGFLGILGITSCDKCQDCHYDTGTTSVEIGELCGDDLEDAEHLGYYDNMTHTLYEVHCEEH